MNARDQPSRVWGKPEKGDFAIATSTGAPTKKPTFARKPTCHHSITVPGFGRSGQYKACNVQSRTNMLEERQMILRFIFAA